MIQAAPAPAHDLLGMGQDLCRRLAPSPAPCPPQGKRASLRRRRSVGSAPANGIDAVKRTASIAFGSCTCGRDVGLNGFDHTKADADVPLGPERLARVDDLATFDDEVEFVVGPD